MIKNNLKSQHQQSKKIIKKHTLIVSEKKNSSIILIALAFCIPVLIYIQTIKFGFTGFDDDLIISKNITFLSNFENVHHAFLTNAFIKKTKSNKFYRPIGTLSYMIDIQLAGGNYPWMFHLSNVLLLGFIACLLFLLLKRFFIPPKLALFSALIYCVHPLFVSSVAWIPAREDLLLTFFSLLSFLLLIEYLNKGKIVYLILHWASFTIDLFCKETAAILPILFVIYFFTFQNEKFFYKKYLFNIVLYSVSGLFWFWLRSKAVEDFSIQGEVFGLAAFILNLRIVPESLAKFILPIDMAPIPSFSILNTITGLGLIVIIIILVFKNLIRSKKEKIFCLSWFLILMFPPLLLKVPEIDYLDHRFFFPLIGIMLFLLFLFPEKWITKGDIKISLLMIVIFIFLCSFTAIKSHSYANSEIFYNSVISHNPNSSLAYNNLGTEKSKKKDFQGAFEDFNKAIELSPLYIEAYYNRGLTYYYLKQFDKAIADYNKAVELNPEYTEAYNNSGNAHYYLKQYDKAITDFSKAINLNSKLSEAYNNRGNAYSGLKQFDKAMADYNKAIELNPRYSEAYNNRGISYYNINKFDEAITDYNKAIELNQRYSEAYNNRGILYYNINKFNEAISDFQTAISLDNNYISAYKSIGSAYFILKNYNEAIYNFSKTIILSVTDAQSYELRGLSYLNINRIDLACKDWLKAKELGGTKSEEYLVKYCK